MPGRPVQVAAGLLRVIANHLEKTLPERVLLLQTDKEVYVLQVRIDLLQAAQDVVVRRVGVLWPGQVASVVEQIARSGDRFTQARRRTSAYSNPQFGRV